MSIKDYNAAKSLNYPKELYSVDMLKSGYISMKEARAEYMRLKSIARKRLERLEQAGFGDTEIYRANKGNYPAQSKLSDAEFVYKLSDLAKFIGSQTSTVTGERAYIHKNVTQLQKHGYTWVDEKNFLEFANFMDYYRTLELDKIYSSEEILEILENKDASQGIDALEKLKNDFEKYKRTKKGSIDSYIEDRADKQIAKAKKAKRKKVSK